MRRADGQKGPVTETVSNSFWRDVSGNQYPGTDYILSPFNIIYQYTYETHRSNKFTDRMTDSTSPSTMITHKISGTNTINSATIENISYHTKEVWLYSTAALAEDCLIINPILNLKTNEPDELTFTVPYRKTSNWNSNRVLGIPLNSSMKFITIVVRSNTHGCIFEGRPIKFARDINNNVTFTCEGALGYLKDVPMFPERFFLTAMDNNTLSSTEEYTGTDGNTYTKYVYKVPKIDDSTGKIEKDANGNTVYETVDTDGYGVFVPIRNEDGQYERDSNGRIKCNQLFNPYDERVMDTNSASINYSYRGSNLLAHILVTEYDQYLYWLAVEAKSKSQPGQEKLLNSYWFENHMFFPGPFCASFSIVDGNQEEDDEYNGDITTVKKKILKYSNSYVNKYKLSGGVSSATTSDDEIANKLGLLDDTSYIDFSQVGTVLDCIKQIAEDCNSSIHIAYEASFAGGVKINMLSIRDDWDFPTSDVVLRFGENITDISVEGDYSNFSNFIIPYGNEIDADMAASSSEAKVSQYTSCSFTSSTIGTKLPNGTMIGYTSPKMLNIPGHWTGDVSNGMVLYTNGFFSGETLGCGNHGIITSAYNVSTDSQDVLDIKAESNIKQQIWNNEEIKVSGIADYCFHTAVHIISAWNKIDGFFNVTEQTFDFSNPSNNTLSVTTLKRDAVKNAMLHNIQNTTNGKFEKNKKTVEKLTAAINNLLY